MHYDRCVHTFFSAICIAATDQGNQFSSYDWQDFLKAPNLEASMSRCRNYYELRLQSIRK